MEKIPSLLGWELKKSAIYIKNMFNIMLNVLRIYFIIFTCHTILFSFRFFQVFKNLQTILDHRLYKNESDLAGLICPDSDHLLIPVLYNKSPIKQKGMTHTNR